MAIHWRLKTYLATKHGIFSATLFQKRIVEKTGVLISLQNLCNLLDKKPKSVRLKTVETICTALDCTFSCFCTISSSNQKGQLNQLRFKGKVTKLSFQNTPISKRQIRKNYTPKHLRDTYNCLNRFYRYCKSKRLVLINPCAQLKPSREQAKLSVIDEHYFKKIQQFIKNESSDPEHALILTLVIFYGLAVEDLSHAQCNADSKSSLQIILRRKPRSKGRRFYNRQQILILPDKPEWLRNLKIRFLSQWVTHRQQTKSSFPYDPLLIARHHHSNRPMCPEVVGEKIMAASKAATGTPIPARILRQTCGHLHSKNGDASLLTTLGWSPQFAFHYTWLPRTYFHSTQT